MNGEQLMDNIGAPTKKAGEKRTMIKMSQSSKVSSRREEKIIWVHRRMKMISSRNTQQNTDSTSTTLDVIFF